MGESECLHWREAVANPGPIAVQTPGPVGGVGPVWLPLGVWICRPCTGHAARNDLCMSSDQYEGAQAHPNGTSSFIASRVWFRIPRERLRDSDRGIPFLFLVLGLQVFRSIPELEVLHTQIYRPQALLGIGLLPKITHQPAPCTNLGLGGCVYSLMAYDVSVT